VELIEGNFSQIAAKKELKVKTKHVLFQNQIKLRHHRHFFHYATGACGGGLDQIFLSSSPLNSSFTSLSLYSLSIRFRAKTVISLSSTQSSLIRQTRQQQKMSKLIVLISVIVFIDAARASLQSRQDEVNLIRRQMSNGEIQTESFLKGQFKCKSHGGSVDCLDAVNITSSIEVEKAKLDNEELSVFVLKYFMVCEPETHNPAHQWERDQKCRSTLKKFDEEVLASTKYRMVVKMEENSRAKCQIFAESGSGSSAYGRFTSYYMCEKAN
jgi:hypothetical protein